METWVDGSPGNDRFTRMEVSNSIDWMLSTRLVFPGTLTLIHGNNLTRSSLPFTEITATLEYREAQVRYGIGWIDNDGS